MQIQISSKPLLSGTEELDFDEEQESFNWDRCVAITCCCCVTFYCAALASSFLLAVPKVCNNDVGGPVVTVLTGYAAAASILIYCCGMAMGAVDNNSYSNPEKCHPSPIIAYFGLCAVANSISYLVTHGSECI